MKMKMYDTPKLVKEKLNLRRIPEPFVSEAAARSYAVRNPRRRIFLGEEQRFWIVGLRDGEKLKQAGYEELSWRI